VKPVDSQEATAAEDAKKPDKKDRPNFGAFLLSFPGGIKFERRTDPMRETYPSPGLPTDL
jgi:hypothetical protein